MPKVVDHHERKRELVEAAWRVIAAKGISDVTTREVAREAGYSHGVLAHYFPTKDELLLAALRMSHGGIEDRYRDLGDLAPIDALTTLLNDNLPEDEQRRLETRIEMSFWERALYNPELQEIQKEESAKLQALLRHTVERAKSDGQVRADVDVDDAVALFAGLIDGLSLDAMLYPDRFPEGRATRLMDLVVSLIGPARS